MDVARTPVTIITGTLGAGKTSLVNHLVATSGQRLAVIVNEFGDIGIDGELIDTGPEELIELNAGCVCCTVRGDLIRTLRALLSQRDFDGVIIETTGLASPGPVIQTFLADQQLAARCVLDAVVTVVDAIHAPDQLACVGPQDQVGLASIVVLNKAGSADDLRGLIGRIAELNPVAPVITADRGMVEPETMLRTGLFSLDGIGAIPTHANAQAHSHEAVTAKCLTLDEPVDAERLSLWLKDLLATHGQAILRTKGIFDVAGHDRKLAVQAVHMLLEGDFIGNWPDGPRQSRLVFIGRDLDRLNLHAQLKECIATVSA